VTLTWQICPMLRIALAALAAASAVRAQNAPQPQPEPVLPVWLKVGAELRGRGETQTGQGYVPGNDDAYYLHRLRLNTSVEPLGWLRFGFQVQDAQAPGFSRRPVPPTVANTLDLRLAHVDLGGDKAAWALRAGRQEFIFGEERLVGAGNWGNAGRAFDALRLTHRRPGARLDWFASSVVVPVSGGFDRPQLKNGFYGFYASLDGLIAGSVLEPYFFWKSGPRVAGESGPPGDQDVYTWGARAVGKLPARFDYNIEMAFQAGHYGPDRIRAWAGHWGAGYTAAAGERAPRVVLEYNHASGDSDPRDGRRGTFDHLFPTNHNKYGTADRVGWRNMHDLSPGIQWRPSSKWRWTMDVHTFWLASRRDALYTDTGPPAVLNPNASSRRIGTEIDLQGTYQFSSRLLFGFGYAHLFPGPYLEQSTPGSGATYPYVMWVYRL
jgi:hypothetical protein